MVDLSCSPTFSPGWALFHSCFLMRQLLGPQQISPQESRHQVSFGSKGPPPSTQPNQILKPQNQWANAYLVKPPFIQKSPNNCFISLQVRGLYGHIRIPIFILFATCSLSSGRKLPASTANKRRTLDRKTGCVGFTTNGECVSELPSTTAALYVQ